CDEKFGPNHTCKNKQLHILLISDEDIKDLEGNQDIIPLPAKEGEDTTQTLQLSQCTMTGLTTKRIFEIMGNDWQ
ncbi:hypothetical protein VIGAN_06120300, partial [Vigna angularis var. angularis]